MATTARIPSSLPSNGEAATNLGANTLVASSSSAKNQQQQLTKDWEKNAALSSEKLNEAVVILQRYCAEKPIPEKFQQESVPLNLTKEDILLEQKIENMQQFYAWFDELGEETVEEERFSSRIETLKSYRQCCDQIIQEIEEALDFLQQLEDKYNLVAKKTGELHQACEVLVQEQGQLLNFADQLEQKLAFFNELPHPNSRTPKFPSKSLHLDPHREK
eukprot:TRINITY_DN2339_c0_g1_i2.p1 TRINITY_DN2339_c0_g1~~TRINITY_DN2339_c0_g1_i2.p1  ORF type:complete len:218 (+),score=49.40 TRINITY_DN2339_c0_g1_i2:249-902(+)